MVEKGIEMNGQTNSTKAEQTELYSFKKMTYVYLIEKEKKEHVQQVGFEKINSKKPCGEIDNNVEYAKIEFHSKYTELNEYFIDILQIFGVSPFTQVWKNRQGRYEFYEDEIKFFCELLYRYAECDIWKKIRKVQNLFFDGFIRIYEEGDGYKVNAR